MKEIIVNNIDQTKEFAKNIADNLKGGEIIVLNGDLGAGKTTFTKFLAKEIGVTENISSPTFTIFKHYVGSKFNLNHFDVYRLHSGMEAIESGLEEFIFCDTSTISVIEWGENIKDILNDNCIYIEIIRVDENKRIFKVSVLWIF